MFNMSHKFEVNALKGTVAPADLVGLGTFALKSGIQAVVCDPSYIDALFADRLRLGCLNRYKIICAVDFDLGKNSALSKFRSLPTNALSADGFDILLSAKRPDKESYNELKVLSEFVHEMVDQTKEVRWVLDLQSRSYEDVQNIMPYLCKFPAKYIRTSGAYINNNVTLDKHLADIKFIRSFIGTPIKIGGGLDFKTVNALALNKTIMFDASATQIRRILRAADEADQAPAAPAANEQAPIAAPDYKIGVDLASGKDQSVSVVIPAEEKV